MKYPAVLACLVLLAIQPVASPAAQKPEVKNTDKMLAAEEKDRLARERKDMEEREALLREQLETRKKLIEAQDDYIRDLEEELKALQRSR